MMASAWFRMPAARFFAALGLSAASGVFCCGTANAQAREEATNLGFNRHRDYVESPQTVAVELRFGRYVPNVDEGLQGTPYTDVFGKGNRYYGGFEVDWQALRIPYLGTLGPGFGIGYTSSTSRALVERTGEPSGQDTTLQILPMYLVGVLRADVIAKKTAIPFVPYAKLGVGYALWRTRDGGDTPRVDGRLGSGNSYGYHAALGGMLLLDWFSLQDARTADANIGLNHSYLFFEWFVSQLDGFGSGDKLQVGTNTWTAGLAFEF